MTAAVARPPIFNHLVASRPDRDRSSIPATIISVALHGAAIGAVVWMGAGVVTTAPPRETHTIVAIPTAIAQVNPLARTSGGGGGAPSVPAAPFTPPTFVPQISAPAALGNEKFAEIFSQATPVPSTGQATPGAQAGAGGAGEPGSFVAFTKAPALLNRPEVARLLERSYPRILLDAGVGGTVVVWLRVDTSGNVLETRISKSSGQEAFDQVALKLGAAMKFSPAFNRDQPVMVWVEIPVVFSAR